MTKFIINGFHKLTIEEQKEIIKVTAGITDYFIIKEEK